MARSRSSSLSGSVKRVFVSKTLTRDKHVVGWLVLCLYLWDWVLFAVIDWLLEVLKLRIVEVLSIV